METLRIIPANYLDSPSRDDVQFCSVFALFYLKLKEVARIGFTG